MKKNIERKVELGFRFSDIISKEEQLIMKMAVSNKQYDLNKSEFEAGKRLHRMSSPMSKAGLRVVANVTKQTWIDQKGKPVDCAKDMARLRD